MKDSLKPGLSFEFQFPVPEDKNRSLSLTGIPGVSAHAQSFGLRVSWWG